MDTARVLGGDPLTGLNSMEGWLQVSKLVVCALGKARFTPSDIAGKRSWEPTSFGDDVSGVNTEAEFSLDGFRHSSDGEERWVPTSTKDSEH